MCESCEGQAGANFQITPQMIEAGTRFLRDSGRLALEIEGLDQETVRGLLSVCLFGEERGGETSLSRLLSR